MKEKVSGIYCIENLISGKKYIGKSEDINTRIKHVHKTCRYLYRAINKYGEENFKRYVIEYCSIEELYNRERFYIKEWNTKVPNGYNLTDGGEGTSGYKFTDEQKENLSKSHNGRIVSQETKDKLSKSLTGIVKSEETRKKLSESHLGIPFTEEHKNNLSISHIGKPSNRLGTHFSEESKIKMSNSKKGVPVHTDKSKKSISDALKGRVKTEEEKQKISNAKKFSKLKNSTSKYIGVYYRKDSNKWRSYIRYDNKRINLGTFEIEKDAAIAYNNAALKYYGEEAKINIIE